MIIELAYFAVFFASLMGVLPYWVILILIVIDVISIYFHLYSAPTKSGYGYRFFVVFIAVLNYIDVIPMEVDLIYMIVSLGWFYGSMTTDGYKSKID